MFRQLFEEGLELQKVRLREQRAYAREQRQEQQRRYQDQFASMENYYKDQVGSHSPAVLQINHHNPVEHSLHCFCPTVFYSSRKTGTGAPGGPGPEKSSGKGKSL